MGEVLKTTETLERLHICQQSSLSWGSKRAVRRGRHQGDRPRPRQESFPHSPLPRYDVDRDNQFSQVGTGWARKASPQSQQLSRKTRFSPICKSVFSILISAIALNDIGSEGARALAHALRGSRGLTQLYLCTCRTHHLRRQQGGPLGSPRLCGRAGRQQFHDKVRSLYHYASLRLF